MSDSYTPNPLNWNEYLTSSPSDNLYDFCIKLITRHYLEKGIDIYSDGTFDKIQIDCVGLALFVIDGIEAGEVNNIGELKYSKNLNTYYNELLATNNIVNNHTPQNNSIQHIITCEHIEASHNFKSVRYDIHGKIKPFETAKWLTDYAKGREFCPPSLVKFFKSKKQAEPPQITTPPPSEMRETQLVKPKRKKEEVSREDMAGYCGVSLSTIKNWETGKTTPPHGYPGRSNRANAIMWGNCHKQSLAMKPERKALKNVSTGHNIDQYSKGYFED